ncbi:MAG: DUF2812 domain-containing protein [Cellulosilyticaceae bacterium]
MSEYKKVWKYFLVTEDYKEEAWLREMALEGYFLESVTGGVHYTFSKKEAGDYTYLVDYRGMFEKAERAYLELFEESGFEYVTCTMGYCYFRAKTDENVTKMRKGEKQRKGEKYVQLRGVMLIIGLLNLFIYGMNMIVNTGILQGEQGMNTESVLFSQINLICGLLLLLIYGIMNSRIKKIRTSQQEELEQTTSDKVAKVMMFVILTCLGIACVVAIGSFLVGVF